MSEATEIDRHVGARIRGLRTIRGLSQGALGRAIGLRHQTLQTYERGIAPVPAGRLHRIARALGVTPGWFFDGLDHVSPMTADHPVLALLDSRAGRDLAEAFTRLPPATLLAILDQAREHMNGSPPATVRSRP